MKVITRGKINWSLHVTGKTNNNYHLLHMVTHSVSIADTITFSSSKKDITLSVQNMEENLNPEDNLAYKAARLLKDTFKVSQGVHLNVEKQIPIGAGMGGGSADAAGVLVGLNHLWQLNLSLSQLENISLPLGADVPFCIRGGLQQVQGIGEKLAPFNVNTAYNLLVIKPPQSISTKAVFTALQFSKDKPVFSNSMAMISALQKSDYPAIAALMHNDLQPVSTVICPDIAKAKEDLLAHGALQAVMTGSGSAVIGLFTSTIAASLAHQALLLYWKECYLTHTCEKGIDLYA